eukprot:357903-Chlamydomonas_euryale.AAC.1
MQYCIVDEHWLVANPEVSLGELLQGDLEVKSFDATIQASATQWSKVLAGTYRRSLESASQFWWCTLWASGLLLRNSPLLIDQSSVKTLPGRGMGSGRLELDS